MNLKPIFGTVLGLVLSAGAAVCEQDLSLVEVEVHKLEPSYYTSSKGSHPSIKTMDIKKLYSQEDLELLAHVINAEQGIEFENEELTNKLQIYTGQVVLNRVKCHHKGADTIEEVIYSEGQYACISDASWDNPVSERAYKNAEILLSGADYTKIYGIPKMPDDVIYQAEFEQGSGVWNDKLYDTFFCYK